ncbi:MAG: hypothetical protein EXR81_01900, partial [Gammaproteobacteria bacterium]|nr:hypothetical protein [Gammaproteobacteria bacterium]
MRIKVILFSLLLTAMNIVNAEWYTVSTVHLPQTLIAGQTYQNVLLTLTNTTQNSITVTSSVTGVPKGFPVNTANACANVTLAPQGSCVLASASAYLVSSDSPAAW